MPFKHPLLLWTCWIFWNIPWGYLFKLKCNWLLQTVNNISRVIMGVICYVKFKQTNQRCSTKKLTNPSVRWRTFDRKKQRYQHFFLWTEKNFWSFNKVRKMLSFFKQTFSRNILAIQTFKRTARSVMVVKINLPIGNSMSVKEGKINNSLKNLQVNCFWLREESGRV